MTIAITILSIALVAFFGMFGGAKLILLPTMVERVTRAGFTIKTCRIIGGLEIAACLGLIVGLYWEPLTAAAAAGLFILMAGAIRAQLRSGDSIQATLPIFWLTLTALATTVLTILNLTL